MCFAQRIYMEIRHCRPHGSLRGCIAVLCVVCLAPGDARANTLSRTLISAQAPAAASATADRIPADQLDSLVAPIALYPDSLLAQVLAASTYPLEIMQLQQWLTRNSSLKGKALVDAAEKQPWDPSVQAMAVLPDVVKRLADDIQWTTDLGNAFLAQQSDVMIAVQRMRQKAESKGTLKSTEQQVVRTEVVENKSVVVIEPSSPDVVYVPSYDPTVVWGAPAYPYPPIYYPPAGYYAAGAAISFGLGVAVGAAWGGGWGWNAGWGSNNININNFNNFNRNANINRAGNINRSGAWQHNPQHRGGTPYRNSATAQRFGGTARGDSLANRQAGARQQVARQGGNLRSNAGVGTGGVGNRGSVGDRGGVGNRGGVGDRGGIGNGGGVGDRGGVGNRGGVGDRGGVGNRGGVGDRGNFTDRNAGMGDRRGSGGANGIGGRDMSNFGGRQNGFSGGGGGFNGDRARSSSSRGSSSFGGSRGGGGFSRGGGGGFSRGGGGGGARRGGGGGGRRR